MSTATPAFAPSDAEVLPSLAVIGYVDSLGVPKITEPKIAEKPEYFLQPIALRPAEAGRTGKVNFMYRPEWLQPGFATSSFADAADIARSSLSFVYRNNIYAGKGEKMSVLAGLAGSDENFVDLSNILVGVVKPGQEGNTGEIVNEALQKFFNKHEGQTIGYILTQQREATGQIDPETRKAIKVRTGYYEVSEFFYTDKKSLDYVRKRAERAKPEYPFLTTFDDAF